MTVLLANYSGVTGGEIYAGGSTVWDQDGVVVAAPPAGEALLIANGRQADLVML